MEILTFLEKLASNAHYNLGLEGIAEGQAMLDKQAFLNNDASFIKNRFVNPEVESNVTHVVMANVTHVVMANVTHVVTAKVTH